MRLVWDSLFPNILKHDLSHTTHKLREMLQRKSPAFAGGFIGIHFVVTAIIYHIYACSLKSIVVVVLQRTPLSAVHRPRSKVASQFEQEDLRGLRRLLRLLLRLNVLKCVTAIRDERLREKKGEMGGRNRGIILYIPLYLQIINIL